MHELEEMMFFKLNEFEKGLLYNRLSSSYESAVIIPSILLDLTKPGIKESINEISRKSTDSDIEK